MATPASDQLAIAIRIFEVFIDAAIRSSSFERGVFIIELIVRRSRAGARRVGRGSTVWLANIAAAVPIALLSFHALVMIAVGMRSLHAFVAVTIRL